MINFSLTLDDFSPHPVCGADFGAIRFCNLLIKRYPEIKITLFVPAAMGFVGGKTYPISESKEWAKRVADLPSYNYSIGCHGFNHRRVSDIHGSLNNGEWEFLNSKEATKLTRIMLSEFKKSDIKFIRIFRPAGWKISRESCVVLKKYKFLCIAGRQRYERFSFGTGIKWINATWIISEKFRQTKNVLNNTIVACGHVNSLLKDHLNMTTTNNISRVIDYFGDDIRFSFVHDIKK